MGKLYRDYIKLLSKWPIDKKKGNSDLGLHLRERIKEGFTKGIEDEKKCHLYYESLERIASNHYFKRYNHKLSNSASGLTLRECNITLAPEVIEALNQQKGFFRKLYNTLRFAGSFWRFK